MRRYALLRRRLQRVLSVLLSVCAIGTAAGTAWLLAGGSVPSATVLLGRTELSVAGGSGGGPVHLDSVPSGAQVSIDGRDHGKTPLDVQLSPGHHTLGLQHPDALDDERTLEVAETGATVNVNLWRRRPDIVPVRPVYPGASLLDARFLNDGQVALLIGLPTQSGASSASRDLWRMDPSRAQLTRVRVPGVDTSASTIVLAPDGSQVAYVTPGSSSSLTTTRWPAAGSVASALPQASQPESVWLAPVDRDAPPRRVFALQSISTPGAPANPEHIVDLVWTPDGSRLVAVTQQPGPTVRSRVFLLNLPPPAADDSDPAVHVLVLLPAEVLTESAVPDPSGSSLVLMTYAVAMQGGSNVLSLCLLQLRPGGAFRDVVDLGSVATPPSATPIAWPLATDTAPDRLVYVGPAPAVGSGGGDLFGLFGALRPSAPSSGLFVANLQVSGLNEAQPRRLGTALNIFGPVWRSETTLLGLARQDDATLALRSIDATSGLVRDLGVRLPISTVQGTGLSARWDATHGQVLLLAHASGSESTGSTVGGGPLQAWLVSFASPNSAAGAAH